MISLGTNPSQTACKILQGNTLDLFYSGSSLEFTGRTLAMGHLVKGDAFQNQRRADSKFMSKMSNGHLCSVLYFAAAAVSFQEQSGVINLVRFQISSFLKHPKTSRTTTISDHPISSTFFFFCFNQVAELLWLKLPL